MLLFVASAAILYAAIVARALGAIEPHRHYRSLVDASSPNERHRATWDLRRLGRVGRAFRGAGGGDVGTPRTTCAGGVCGGTPPSSSLCAATIDWTLPSLASDPSMLSTGSSASLTHDPLLVVAIVVVPKQSLAMPPRPRNARSARSEMRRLLPALAFRRAPTDIDYRSTRLAW